jgi:protein-S-isoprenylcysteine O-methyltransferase Ste14
MPALIVVAWVLHLVCRLAYVVGVGAALTRQDRDGYFTRTAGVRAGFQRFEQLASPVMAADAVTFVILALVSHDTWPWHVGIMMRVTVGAALIAVGIGVKIWARNTLGADAYYWYNFFAPDEWKPPEKPGPYRWFKHPMYTVGYLHAWGFAFAMASLPALIAAAFDQAAILAFARLVEAPHFRRLVGNRN